MTPIDQLTQVFAIQLSRNQDNLFFLGHSHKQLNMCRVRRDQLDTPIGAWAVPTETAEQWRDVVIPILSQVD